MKICGSRNLQETRKTRGVFMSIELNAQGGVSIPLPTSDMSSDDLFRLGIMYSTGQGGVAVDLVSAHMMFNLASMRGSVEGGVYRRELSREMDREDVAEAQKQARYWLDQGRAELAA